MISSADYDTDVVTRLVAAILYTNPAQCKSNILEAIRLVASQKRDECEISLDHAQLLGGFRRHSVSNKNDNFANAWEAILDEWVG